MDRKKILICGATGFIGRNIIEAFAGREDMEVYGTYFRSEPFDCPGVVFVRADLQNKEEVDKAVAGKDTPQSRSRKLAGQRERITPVKRRSRK